MTPEGRVKAACLRYLAGRGIEAWNNPTGAAKVGPDRWMSFGRKGSSDIIGLLPGGRFLAVEVKAPGGRLSPEQAEFLETVRGMGGLAVVARSRAELDAALRAAGHADDGPLFGCKTES